MAAVNGNLDRQRQNGATEHTPLLSEAQRQSVEANGDGQGNRQQGESAQGPEDIPMPPLRSLVPICVALWVPVFVASLDGTIVATLIGSVSSSFNKSEQAAWLGTSYLLSVCCFSPIYGRLCDILGRRYAMLLALSLFSVGTLLCGVAPSMELLIASRALAGAGGGGLTTCTSTIMSDIVPLRNRGLYQGLTNIIFGLGSGLGGPVGGFLNDTWGWRNAFLVQTPFLVISIILSCYYIHVRPVHDRKAADYVEPKLRDKLKSIDILGCLTLVGCVGLILVSLSSMSADDRTIDEPMVWGGLLGGVISGFLFVYVEKYVAKNPILPLRILTQKTGGSVAVANLFQSITSFAILYNYPLYFQAVRLESSSQAGLHLIPNSISISVGSVAAGVYMRQTGVYHKYNLFNAALMVVSSVWVMLLKPDTPEWITYIAVIPSGFGISGVLTCLLLALINSVPRSDIAVATGISYLFRTTGQVVGVSLSGAVLQAVLKRELRNRIVGPDSEELIAKIRHQLNVIPTLAEKYQEAAILSYDIALKYVYAVALVGATICTVASYLVEDRRLPEVGGKGNSEDDEAQRQSSDRGS